MKINLTPEFLQPAQPARTEGKGGKGGETDFSRILETTLGNFGGSAKAPAATPALSGSPTVSPVKMEDTDHQSAVAQGLEDALVVIENYSQALADPACSMEDIAPYVKRMAVEQEKIWSVMDRLPVDDGLRSVAQEVLVTLSTEVSRFERGDYA